jgi:hypothetical protein
MAPIGLHPYHIDATTRTRLSVGVGVCDITFVSGWRSFRVGKTCSFVGVARIVFLFFPDYFPSFPLLRHPNLRRLNLFQKTRYLFEKCQASHLFRTISVQGYSGVGSREPRAARLGAANWNENHREDPCRDVSKVALRC